MLVVAKYEKRNYAYYEHTKWDTKADAELGGGGEI